MTLLYVTWRLSLRSQQVVTFNKMIVTFFSHWSEQELQQDNPERGHIPGEELHPGITSVLLVNVYKDG